MGIFRLPGQAKRVQNLKELYDQGQSVTATGRERMTGICADVQVASRTSQPQKMFTQ